MLNSNQHRGYKAFNFILKFDAERFTEQTMHLCSVHSIGWAGHEKWRFSLAAGKVVCVLPDGFSLRKFDLLATVDLSALGMASAITVHVDK